MNKDKEIELIKEVEELKLKQKILINILKGKKKDKLEDILKVIHNRLEFLIKLITDASSDSEVSDFELELKKGIEEMNKKLEKKFEEFSERLKNIEKKLELPPIDIKKIVTSDSSNEEVIEKDKDKEKEKNGKSNNDIEIQEIKKNVINK